jgi:hypothetical protein
VASPDDRSGAMSPSNQSEDKLQKYFGIPQSQYRVTSPDPDRERHARTTSNHIQPSVANYAPRPSLAVSDYDRPGVSQSSQSTQDTGASPGAGSLGSRVGSVKKRLSMLGIGKKASKSSVRSRGGQESLVEE